jgi:hypothetical protein
VRGRPFHAPPPRLVPSVESSPVRSGRVWSSPVAPSQSCQVGPGPLRSSRVVSGQSGRVLSRRVLSGPVGSVASSPSSLVEPCPVTHCRVESVVPRLAKFGRAASCPVRLVLSSRALSSHVNSGPVSLVGSCHVAACRVMSGQSRPVQPRQVQSCPVASCPSFPAVIGPWAAERRNDEQQEGNQRAPAD